MSDLLKQLSQIKNSPEAGCASRDVHVAGRARVLEAIQHSEAEDAYGFKNGVAYYFWIFQESISKQVIVASMACVFVLGGWMTSVNAATNSLPGDTLYSFKLATERARLKLASQEHRAILHTEFAGRRYREALAIESAPERKAYLEGTYNAFKEQMNLANNQLEILRTEGGQGTVEVATALDQKLTALNNEIEGSAAQPATRESVAKVADAREALQKTEVAAVDAIVETHEKNPDPVVSRLELEQLFRKEVTELRTREAFNLGRLTVIEGTITANPERFEGVQLPVGESLNVIAFNITKTAEAMNEAMNLAAAGGFRSAFDIIRDANAELLVIEGQLASIELTILEAFAASVEEPVEDEPAAEGAQSSESTTTDSLSPEA